MIIQGDCLDILPTLDADSFDACVTDPPYGLEFMGKGWDKAVPGAKYWTAALRVLKPGAYLLAFGGTRTFHRMACAIEDAGFELRDTVMWVYGSGFPKSHNGEWGGTALKPAWEPIIVARKALIGTVAQNFAQHGTGGLNIDACRAAVTDADKSQLRTMERGRRTEDTSGQTWGLSKCSGDTPQVVRPDGRWPANLIHDGSEEVVASFPATISGKPCDVKAGNNNNVFGQFAGGIPVTGFGDSGSAARFFYCAKATKTDRNEGCENIEPKQYSHDGRRTSIDNAYQRNASNASNASNAHPTVKPTALMRYLCRLVTPTGGTVLDPFAGSGSTGKAAVLEGFNFTGIEREGDYARIAAARIAAVETYDVFA